MVGVEADEVPVNRPAVLFANHPDGIAAMRAYRDGALVAEGSTDTLELDLSEETVGTAIDVLIVAVAQNATVTREGWPIDTVSVHAPADHPSADAVTRLQHGHIVTAPARVVS